MDFEPYHRRLRDMLDAGVITAAEYEPYDVVLPWNRIRLHYTTQAEFAERAQRFFRIERTRWPGDYTGSENHPVYTLVKR